MSESDFIEGDPLEEFDPAELDRMEAAKEDNKDTDEDKVLALIRRRRLAYTAVFTEGQRSQADIDIVLNDLFWFCRANAPTFDKKDGIHADTLMKLKEGRREVHARIRDFAGLSFDALILKYTDALNK